MTTRYFKILDANGRSCNGGDAQWNLPTGDQPGEWMPPIKGPIEPCENGYHLCRGGDLIHWLGPVIWLSEVNGVVIECADKVVVSDARLIRRCEHWNERNARLFACWCAEQVLPLFEVLHPHDTRPRDCIEVARAVANGDRPASDMATARSAAWAARSPTTAARAAAGDVAWAAWAARDAAWAAARDAQTHVLVRLLDTGELP